MERRLVEVERVGCEPDDITGWRREFDRSFLKMVTVISDWVLRNWLLCANLANGVIIAGAVAVPLMRAGGLEWIAGPLFSAYHVLCEQRPERSYFLLGYQMAMDQRMMAIYGSSLIAGIVYLPLRGTVRPCSWRTFFWLSLPMAVDGFTQLFGWRYSTWELRTITGTLFGVGTVWLMYPYFDLLVHQLLGGRASQEAAAVDRQSL